MRKCVLSVTALALALPCAAVAQEPAQPDVTSEANEAAAQAKIAAVQRHVDAYRSGDLDRFVATFAHDAIVRADGFVAMGRPQIRAMYELNFLPGSPALKVYESGIKGKNVYLSLGYVLESGQELCCSYTEYEINAEGKVSFLETSSG